MIIYYFPLCTAFGCEVCTVLLANYINGIKTHNSESQVDQEEAGRMQQTSELFTGGAAMKLANTLNKPP